MALRLPDWLVYEIRHRLERVPRPGHGVGLRDRINDNPLWIGGLTAFSLLLLLLVWGLASRSTPQREFEEGRRAWFYDQNTGELFVGSSKKTGPIAAPSGPLPNGEPAGVRARVYSYVLDPDESKLFVGFLERPDPDTPFKASAADMKEFSKWARGRLVKRVEDEQWVAASSPEGHEIVEALTRPNRKGQTPIYHTPK